jgi:membrane protein
MTATQPSERLEVASQGSNPVDEVRSRVSSILANLTRTHQALLARNQKYALLYEFFQEYQEHQPSNLAKQTAYSLLYAVPSILITLVSLAAVADHNTGFGISDSLREYISTQAPSNLQPLLQSLVQYALVQNSAKTALLAALISLAIAIWGGAGGVGAMVYAINDVFDVRNTRSFIKSALVNVGLMVLSGLLVIAAFFLLAFGEKIAERFAAQIGYGSALIDFLSSGPIFALPLLLGSLLLLYWFGLDAPKSLRWLLPGAVASTLAMAFLIAVLDRILSYSNPGTAYGVAGGVLILLWTLYMLSQIVVIGAILNAVLARKYDRKFNDGLKSQPEKQRTPGKIAVMTYQ